MLTLTWLPLTCLTSSCRTSSFADVGPSRLPLGVVTENLSLLKYISAPEGPCVLDNVEKPSIVGALPLFRGMPFMTVISSKGFNSALSNFEFLLLHRKHTPFFKTKSLGQPRDSGRMCSRDRAGTASHQMQVGSVVKFLRPTPHKPPSPTPALHRPTAARQSQAPSCGTHSTSAIRRR